MVWGDIMPTFILQNFMDCHPPKQDQIPAVPERIGAWSNFIPASLIEIWIRSGFGFYGDSQLCLLNPDEWVSILDRWVTPISSASARAPVLMSPFGDLFYYRKLAGNEEDISVIYIDSCEVEVISWRLDDFFNGTLCNMNQLRNLMPAQLDWVQKRYGLLERGQIYQMTPPKDGRPISVEKVSAKQAHEKRLDGMQKAI